MVFYTLSMFYVIISMKIIGNAPERRYKPVKDFRYNRAVLQFEIIFST